MKQIKRFDLRIDSGNKITATAFNKYDSFLAIGTDSGLVEVFNLRLNKKIFSEQTNEKKINALAFHPNNKYMEL